MKNHITGEGNEGLGDVPFLEDAGSAGIEVHEPIDIESIELGSRNSGIIAELGWEVVPSMRGSPSPILDGPAPFLIDTESGAFDGDEVAAAQQLEALEQEQLRLVADLAELRRVAARRERMLESELVEAREQVAARESELSEQFAQIASLTLECGGLRSQLKSLDGIAPAAGGSATNSGRGDQEMVALLKERLAERSSVIAVAKGEAEELREECTRLRGILARRLARDSNGRGKDGRDWHGNLRRLLARVREKIEAKHLAAFAGEPGTEVSTLAVDQAPGPAGAAGATSVEARILDDARRQRRRQLALDAVLAPLKPSPVRPSPSLRRYLIGLSPEREEVHELSAPRMYVGRGAEADLRLADATVSRLHGVLSLEDGNTVIEDVASRNGTFVNGQRTSRAALRDGDTVVFGTVRYQFRVGPASRSGH